MTNTNAPECPRGHGPMVLRAESVQTAEQRWCGTWYDCPPGAPGYHCTSSHLIPSDELRALSQ